MRTEDVPAGQAPSLTPVDAPHVLDRLDELRQFLPLDAPNVGTLWNDLREGVVHIASRNGFLEGLGLEIDSVDDRALHVFQRLLEIRRQLRELEQHVADQQGEPRQCEYCGKFQQQSREAGYMVNGEFFSSFQMNQALYRCQNTECRAHGIIEVVNRTSGAVELRFPAGDQHSSSAWVRERSIAHALRTLMKKADAGAFDDDEKRAISRAAFLVDAADERYDQSPPAYLDLRPDQVNEIFSVVAARYEIELDELVEQVRLPAVRVEDRPNRIPIGILQTLFRLLPHSAFAR